MTPELKRYGRASRAYQRQLSGTARNPGIQVSLVRQWMNAKQNEGNAASPGHEHQVLTAEQQEMQNLRKETKIRSHERGLLNTATAFFFNNTLRDQFINAHWTSCPGLGRLGERIP